ncbi:MAG TPA: Ig-like domain-containing protein, partial [Gemmatimonadaceae bacterium]|nr:Ig-like domain-containing protein [Gemmatimonadaceae bacterium]
MSHPSRIIRLYRSVRPIALAWIIGSCGGGDSVVGPPPPPPPTTATITLSAGTVTLVPAENMQISATAKDAAGQALSRVFTWTSSDLAKATVSSSGMVTGVAPGNATITAAVDGKSASATVSVLDGGVVSAGGDTLNLRSGDVRVIVPPSAVTSPTDISVVESSAYAGDARVVKGTPFDFGPSGTQFAKPVSIRIKYLESNLPAGTEQAALQIHLATANGWQVVPGSVVDVAAKTVTADVSHFSVYAILTPLPVAAVSIAGTVEHPVTNGAAQLTVGDQAQLTATATDAQGNALENRSTTWTSSDATIASVTPVGLVTALKPGPATITATMGGVSSTVSVVVSPIPVTTVNVSLASSSITAVETVQASATTLDGNGNALTGRTISWSSSNTAVATVDANGLVAAVAPGTTNIIGTSEGKTGSAILTVTQAPVATITVSLNPSSISAVQTSQATAILLDAHSRALSGRNITWSSDNTSIASVDANGLVTAHAAGSATVSASSEGKTGSAVLTVDAAPVASVTVTPESATLVLGITPTQQLSAVTKDGNGSVLAGRLVTWSSSDATVASVDANGLVTAHIAGSATVTATSEGKSATSAITVSAAPVATVTVALDPGTISAIGTSQASATLRDANGNVLLGRTVVWASDNNAVATVSATGLVTAVASGTASITATIEGKTGSATLTVTPAAVATVTVNPASATLVLGTTANQQLSAVAKDANGNVLSGRAVTWSSNASGVASVDANGLVTAVSPGSAIITAASEGKTGTSTITVSVAPVASVSVALSPSSVTAGGTSQATATTRDANGNVVTGRVVTWSSDNTAVANIDANGHVITLSAGTANIIATSEGKAGSALLTVTAIPVATVLVSPSSATLVLGITPTQQLGALTKDANGNTLTGRVVTWSSSNTAAATVDANGLVTAVAAGSATITATSEGKTGMSSITVSLAPVASVNVALSAASITASGTSQATATTRDVNGNILTGRTVSWSSDNTSVATVDATGLVTAVSVGTAHIIATSEGKTGSAQLTVTPTPVASVTVSPSSATLTLGITPTQQLTAVTKDANGTTLSGRVVTWSSSNSEIATVDANGLVTAVSAGPATINATSEGKTGTSSITVNVAPVATVTVALSQGSITAVGTSQATATTRDANGNVLTGRTVTWS